VAHTVGLGSVRSRAGKGEVISLKFSIKLQESLDEAVLNITSLLETVARRESESSNTATSSAASGENVFTTGIDLTLAQIGGVHIGGVLGIGSVYLPVGSILR